MRRLLGPRAPLATARSSAGGALLLTLLACSAPPAPRPAPEPAPSPIASAPGLDASAAEPPLAPGELRCGIDDGPVPVGLRGDDETDLRGPHADADRPDIFEGEGSFLGLRVAQRSPPPAVAAKPKVSVQWKLGEGVIASDAFTQRAKPCSLAGDPRDEGERSFSIRFSAQGKPLTVRGPDRDADTVLTRCSAAALCSVEGAAGDAAVRAATLAVKVSAPVFTGNVQFHVLDERPTTTTTSRGLGRRRLEARLPYSPEEQRYLGDLHGMLGKGAIACVRATPPANRVTLWAQLSFDKTKRAFAFSPPGPGSNDFERKLAACFGASAAVGLRPPPAGLVPRGSLTVFVTVSPGPEDAP